MKLFMKGAHDGIPISLGYLSVSFGFGINAVALGLTVLQAVGISASNLTSAGQLAGIQIIAAGGSIIEMILTQIIINIRYSLMGIALSQKLDNSFSTMHRLLASFGITDEIFAVAYSQKGDIKPAYMYGLISVSFIGWTGGTLLGAAAGAILPETLTGAMGLLLYGMFLAIILPAAREEKGVLFTVLIAAVFSIAIKYGWPLIAQTVGLPEISGGFSVIISAVLASAAAAWLFPQREEEQS